MVDFVVGSSSSEKSEHCICKIIKYMCLLVLMFALYNVIHCTTLAVRTVLWHQVLFRQWNTLCFIILSLLCLLLFFNGNPS